MFSLGVYYLWHWLQAEHVIAEQSQTFVVEPGDSVSAVAMRLHRQGLLRWPNIWRAYARFFDPQTIKKGEYDLGAKTSPLGILNLLQSGDVITYWVTLVEGKNIFEIVALLNETPKLKQPLDLSDLTGLSQQLGIEQSHPEGWFYPDTYQFRLGETVFDILTRAHKKMQKVLDEEWAQRAENLPYASPYEALIMASIVEKETGAAWERKKISGVFVRRLEKNMRLQTDPTVIYGMLMNNAYSGNITRKDLKTDTPYNTYYHKGLPPTPIASAGREAINAALHPAAGNELYFVAKGDGTHAFSSTLDEHNKAVNEFQRFKRTKNYRSSPEPGATNNGN